MRALSILATLAATLTLLAAAPAPVSASPVGVMCTIGGLVSGLVGKACHAAQHAGRVLSAGRKLLGGHVGGALRALSGSAGTAAGSLATRATFAVGFAALGAWILGGTRAALSLVAGLVDHTTRPQLRSTWFSATYWRVAGISALLTLPFLFAAAVQALLRADLALLGRAAAGYLPLALLAVAIAAPLTMLLLSAVDAMSSAIDGATGGAGGHFLGRLTRYGGALTLFSRSPFLGSVLALLLVMVSVVLWLELLVRDAAIYVVVLMLPLAFATLVWPARRVWVTRTVELLFALILSKFAIVAVLSLGGAALNAGGHFGAGKMSLGLVLVGLAATSPWVLMRLLPMAELAGSLQGMRGGGLSQHSPRALERGEESHARMDGRSEADGGSDVPADPARAELEKLTTAAAPSAAASSTPAAAGSREPPAPGPAAAAEPGPEPPSDGVHVAGVGEPLASRAPMGPEELRDLGGAGKPTLIVGVNGHGQGAETAPPDGDAFGPRESPDVRPPEAL